MNGHGAWMSSLCSLHLERVEKPVKCVKSNFVLNHIFIVFSYLLGGEFLTYRYLVILRNCRQSVNTPKWNRFVSVVSFWVLFLGKPIKDETLMGSFHARLHNGKAKVLLDLTKRVSQVELHLSN